MGYTGMEGLSPEERETQNAKVMIVARIVFVADRVPAQQEREWTWGDAQTGKLPDMGDPFKLPFLTEPRRSWPRPQGPIIFSALVPVGQEDDAIEWLTAL